MTWRLYCEGLFTGVNVSDEMNLDAAGEVEATFDRRVDDRDLFQVDHRVGASSCVRVNVWPDCSARTDE
jgi:hypothetical protein